MKISIVTVCFNAAATIEDTLRSVAAQDHLEIEHIVVDGGSTDETLAIVGRYPHVSRVVSEPDRGIYDAMNKGLRLATGDAVGFLNSDDFLSRQDAVTLIAGGLAASGADAVVADVALVDPNNIAQVRRHYDVARYRPWMMRFGHMPPHATLYVRRHVLQEIGEFDDSFRIAGDFDLTVRLLLRRGAQLHRLRTTLVGFREGGVSTRDIEAKLRMNREILRSLRQNGFAATLPQLYARYAVKILQYATSGCDYRVPSYLQPANADPIA